MHPLTIESSNAMRAMAVTAAMLAAYAAFSMAERIGRTDNSWSRQIWLVASSGVLGLGMWSMHFFGALEDPAPGEAVYSLRLVLLCLVLAVSSAYAGIRLIAWQPDSRVRMVLGASLIGGGVLAMYFLGVHALRSMVVSSVRPGWIFLAALTSVTTALLACWMVFGERGDATRGEWMRVGGSLVLGAGFAVVHAVAVHASTLVPLAHYASVRGSVRGSGVGEAALLTNFALVLLVTLGTAAMDKRRFRAMAELNAQLAASEQRLQESESRLRDANDRLSEMSFRDSLTGLYNRRHFDEVFDTEWRRSLRTGRPLALLMIDVDCFKALNDNYGHQRGDECLREVARVLEEQPRRGHDIVARFGGEEFAVLLPGADVPGAMRIAHSVRSAVEALQLEHGHSRVGDFVTVSVGVCSRIPHQEESSSDLLYEADMALYLAKQLGRNRVELREAVSVGM